MSRTRKVLISLGVLLLLLQVFQPIRNKSPHISEKDITVMYQVPDGVKAILQSSCYDCHSNNTQYPWYSYVQPMGWWLTHHINEGKAELNLSEFGEYSVRRQQSKLKAIAESVEDGDMPLSSYTLIHTSAKLSLTEKKQLLDWVAKTKDRLSQLNKK
jgi:hypothetical protein